MRRRRALRACSRWIASSGGSAFVSARRQLLVAAVAVVGVNTLASQGAGAAAGDPAAPQAVPGSVSAPTAVVQVVAEDREARKSCARSVPVRADPSKELLLRDGGLVRAGAAGIREHGRAVVGFAWERCDAAGSGCVPIKGAAWPEYVPSPDDVGHTLRAVLSLDAGATEASPRSRPSPLVRAAAPSQASRPLVFGRSDQAGALTAVADLWFGTPPFELAYQWFRCDKAGNGCAAIFGATGQTYVSSSADAKAGSVVVEATAANSEGSASARSEPFTFAAQFSTLALTCWDTPINTSAPTISPSGSIDAGGQLFLSFPGFWDPSTGTCPGWQFRYAWFRSSALVVDNGTSNNPYNTSSGDIGGVMQDQVTYEYTGPNGYHAASSRSNGVLVTAPPPPPNNAPYFVEPFGPVGGTTPPDGGGIYAQYNDPDGDSGTVTISVYAYGTSNLLSQSAFPNIGANTYPPLYMSIQFTGHVLVHIDAVDNRGAPSTNYVEFEMWATNVPGSPGLVSPLGTQAAPSLVTSPTPVLKATATDPETDPVGVDFKVTTAADCANGAALAQSPRIGTVFLAGTGNTATWRVPEDKLTDNTTYYWCARAADLSITFGASASGWSAARAFTVRVPGFGVRSSWPVWQRGPLAVNEATGNLVVAMPGPSYPTGIGDLSMSVAYNSLDGRGNLFGLGTKWVVGTVGTVPAKLIDHNLFSQVPPANEFYDGIERVNADGSSDYYAHVGNADSGAYVSETGDRSQLFRNANSSWTLADPDGSVYTFASTAAADFSYPLISAEVAVGKTAAASFFYTPDGQGRIDLIEAKMGTTVLASLDFNWACAGALLCVTGPDGRTWQYIGESGATGRLRTVKLTWSGGSRDLARVTYDASGRLVGYETANDIADTVAGWRTTHQVAVDYYTSTDSPTPDPVVLGRVQSVTDGPIRRDLAANPTTDLNPVWTFTYTPKTLTPPPAPASLLTTATAAAHTGTTVGTQRPAAGYTEVCPPRQQPTCALKDKVFYDSQWQTMETRNVASPTGITKVNYDGAGRMLWSEDELGKPTDVTFDPVTNLITKSEGPDPDGDGPQMRLTTLYRHDEKAVGTVSTVGTALLGLQAAYYSDQTVPVRTSLAGRPTVLQTDANVDATWAGAPVSGVAADNFSVRWRGLVNIPTAGDYKFSTIATGGTRLYVDGTQLIDKWESQVGEVCSVETSLTDGKHQIVLEYKDSGVAASSANVQLRRTAATQYPASPACTDGGTADGTVIASTDLVPNYGNQTTTISQSTTDGQPNRLSFTHFAEPWLGVSDYTLALNGSEQLITSFTHDSYGRIVSKVMPKGNSSRTISTTPGPTEGDLTGTPDPTFRTDWLYYLPTDPAIGQDSQCGSGTTAGQKGLLKQLSSPGVTAVTTVYDLGGRPLSVDSGTRVVCRAYAADGRLEQEKAKKDSEGSLTTTAYTYDADGNTLSVTEGGAPEAISTTYNEVGAILESEDASAVTGAKARPTYDLEGNVTQRVAQLPAGGASYTSSYTYDAENRVSSQTDPAGRQYGFLYDARGFLYAVNYPNSTFLWRTVSDAGLVTALHVRHGQVTTPGVEPADTQASPIVEYAYEYFQNGQRKSENRTGGASGSPIATTGLTGFVYDPVGRLEQVSFPGSIGSRRYCLDRDSNRAGFTASATTPCTTLAATYNYSASAMDRLTSVVQGATTAYAYDADGNVTGRGADTFTWDRYGRLAGSTTPASAVSLSGVQFKVDGANNGSPVTGASPYQKTLDTTALSNGWHTIGATVTTSAGKQTSVPTRVVKVQNGTPPTAAFVKQLTPVSSTTSGSTLSLPVPAAGVAAGSTLVVLGGSLTASIASVTDSKGNSYSVDRSFTPTPWSATNIDYFGANGLRVTSNQAAVATCILPCPSGDRYNTAAAAQADGVVFVKVAAVPTTSTDKVAVAARIQNPGTFSAKAYVAVYEEAGASDTYKIRKLDSGTWTTLTTLTGANMAAGDSLGLKTQGSTISLWRKPAAGSWTQLSSTSDSTISGAGLAGLMTENPSGFSAAAARMDDFTVASDFTLPGGGAPPVTDDFNRADSSVLYTTPRAISVASGLITTPLVSGDTVTVAFDLLTSRRVATALEFSGILTSGRLDQVTQIKSGSGTALSTNTTATTAQADEFLVGGFAADNASTFTAGTGYTVITSGSAGTSSIVGLHGEWKLVSSTGAYAATATKATSTGWTSGLVTYKAISSASDTTAPTTPGTPTLTVTPGTAQLGWTASTDTGGVAYYRVHRSLTSGFTPGPANEIGQTTQLTYTDNGDGSGNGLPAGSYYYKLVAIDTSANASTASAQSAVATVVADAQLPTGAFTTPTPATTTTVNGNVTLAVAAAPPTPTVNTLAYGFDPTGFRTSRTLNAVTTKYLLGGLIETTAAGAITLFDIDGPAGDLAHYTAAPTPGQTAVSFLHYNTHGDLAAETNTAGTRTAAYTYDPYGAPLETPPADTATERWTGQWDKKLDTTTNLIEMGARAYDPSIGRFYAIDPVEGGSANHYDYANQDPTNAYDLDGTRVISDGDNCHLTCNTAATGGFAGSAFTDGVVAWVKAKTSKYGSSCIKNGATSALFGGATGFAGGCVGGIFLQVWSEQPGTFGASGRAATKFVDVWTVRRALHKGFNIPKFVDLLRANGVRVRIRYIAPYAGRH